MRRKINLKKGFKCNNLTVIKKVGQINPKDKCFYYLCKCDCGKELTVKGGTLFNLNRKSCGCVKGGFKKTHNMSKSRLYSVWTCMKRRCLDKKHKSYSRYGGRGIKVCKLWLYNFNNFKTWAEKSGYNDSLTIDRINVNGDYKPSNCRWATPKEQSNNMSNNHWISYGDKKQTMSQWARELNVPITTLASRLERGYSIEKLLTKKVLSSISIEINGITKKLSEWAKIYNVKTGLIRSRIKNGWDKAKAVTTPKIVNKKKAA